MWWLIRIILLEFAPGLPAIWLMTSMTELIASNLYLNTFLSLSLSHRRFNRSRIRNIFRLNGHTMAHPMIAPGVRVARGPDWSWQNQGNPNRPSNWWFVALNGIKFLSFCRFCRRWRRSHRHSLWIGSTRFNVFARKNRCSQLGFGESFKLSSWLSGSIRFNYRRQCPNRWVHRERPEPRASSSNFHFSCIAQAFDTRT